MHPLLTVLVVDDDAAITNTIRWALEDAGHRVLAATGPASLKLAQAEHPDVILLDVLMPERSGVELSQALRAMPETVDIPIVSMSAHMQAHTPIAMRAEAHLAKPFALDTLLATVQHWGAHRTADVGTIPALTAAAPATRRVSGRWAYDALLLSLSPQP